MLLKAYVIVRSDLPKIQQGVQAAHAIAELAYAAGKGDCGVYKQWVEQDKTLILLKARDVGDLNAQRDRVKSLGLTYHMFHEPDRNNEPTALAIYPGTYAQLEPHFGMMELA